MSVKDSVRKILEEGRGEFFSGETMAQQLKVTRNTIWKAIQALKEEGYDIESVPNRGYALRQESDALSREEILRYAATPSLSVFQTIDSTNEELKRQLGTGAPHGTLVVANQQTAGKGRRGRPFYSPSDTGVYFSVLLQLGLDFSDSVLVTTAASVAVCRAIEKVCGLSCGIKWVNDVYLNGRKICGILTEGVTDIETGEISSIICGIGINVRTTRFPGDVGDVASSLFPDGEKKGIRSRLVAEAYNELMEICNKLPDHSYMEEYRRRSIVLGKEIRYTDHGDWKNARVYGIDEDGGLMVDTEEGKRTLHSGEITIRVQKQDMP